MASQQDPTNNNQAEEPKQETFKDRLDRAATESRSKSPQESTPNPIVEKSKSRSNCYNVNFLDL